MLWIGSRPIFRHSLIEPKRQAHVKACIRIPEVRFERLNLATEGVLL
jgi:hypothetical protein